MARDIFVKNICGFWFIALSEDFDVVVKGYIKNEKTAVRTAENYGRKYYQNFKVVKL